MAFAASVVARVSSSDQRPACPVGRVRHWVTNVVVGLKLCPWASQVQEQNAVVFVEHTGGWAPELDSVVATHVACLRQWHNNASKLPLGRKSFGARNGELTQRAPTVLIVLTNEWFADFESFLMYADNVEHMIAAMDCEGVVQLATFHPKYVFGDSEGMEDVTNYTNRSPLPVLHLLASLDVERAIEMYGEDTELIWRANKDRLKGLAARRDIKSFWSLL